MRVAIIGSGISGLACAFRLNQLGVKPAFFERKPIIGEVIDLYAIHLNCFNHLSKNPLSFFRKKYGLSIEPMEPIKKLTMYAGKKEVNIQGRLGYVFNRGAEKTSLELQLFRQVEADFHMDTYVIDTLLDDIAKQFDAVVVATGNTDIPDSLGIMRQTSFMMVRCGILFGKYERGRIISWVKTEFTNNAYIYLIPISETKALLTFLSDSTTPGELDYSWKQMLQTENMGNNILETWDSEFHSGRLKTNRLGNIYFIGNAGGMTDDFIGFGMMNCIAGGIFAAEAIVQGKDFEKVIKPIQHQVEQLHNLRLLADRMNKRMWKQFISVLGLPGMRHLVYKSAVLQFHHIGRIVGTFIKKDK